MERDLPSTRYVTVESDPRALRSEMIALTKGPEPLLPTPGYLPPNIHFPKRVSVRYPLGKRGTWCTAGRRVLQRMLIKVSLEECWREQQDVFDRSHGI